MTLQCRRRWPAIPLEFQGKSDSRLALCAEGLKSRTVARAWVGLLRFLTEHAKADRPVWKHFGAGNDAIFSVIAGKAGWCVSIDKVEASLGRGSALTCQGLDEGLGVCAQPAQAGNA